MQAIKGGGDMGLPGFTAAVSIYRVDNRHRMAMSLVASATGTGASPQGEPSRWNMPELRREYLIPWFEEAYWAREAELGWGCNGLCAIVQCTPTNPCYSDLITYTTGNRCASEGSICDPGVYNCTCNTTIDWAAGAPKCTCS